MLEEPLRNETLLFFLLLFFFDRLQGLGGGASCPAAIHRLLVNSQQELLCRPVISYQPHIQEGGQGNPEHGELDMPSITPGSDHSEIPTEETSILPKALKMLWVMLGFFSLSLSGRESNEEFKSL